MTTNTAIDIGSTTQTTVGTITVGTWQASLIALAYGGTNANLTASNGGIFYSTASAGAILAGTATARQMLQSGSSTTPAWSTAVYPATTTINQILYSSANNTITGLATSATAVLTTSSSVPTWAAELSLALGGTNANLTASNGGIFYSTASAGAILAGTATADQVLLSGSSTTPAWSTATYPATTTINQLLYSSSANVIAGLATANSGVLITSAGGVPSIGTTLPTGVQTNITELGTVTVGVWNASLIPLAYGGTNANLTASNGGIFYSTASAGAILAGTATARQMLQSGASTTPAWSTATYPATTTINQILYSSSANTVAGLATATTAVLTTSASVPTWASELSLALGGTNAALTASNGGIFYSTASAGAILSGTATANQILMSGASTTPAWSTATYPATTTVSQILYSSSANVIGGITTANSGVLVTNSTGVPAFSGTMTNGQVIIGSTSATPTAATLTAGSNVTITNGAGTITIAASGGGGSTAWASLNYKGTTSRAIEGSTNVTSVTANGTGDYTVNFTSSADNANYSAGGLCGANGGATGALLLYGPSASAMTTSAYEFYALNSGFANADAIRNTLIFTEN